MCIVKEDLDEEVQNFAAAVWPGGEILLDESLAWFKAIGGGSVDKKSLFGFLFKVVNPFSKVAGNMKLGKGVEGNLKGEGLIVGGLYVIRQGGDVEFSFREEEIGDHAPLDEVVDAAKRAAAACGSRE